LDAKAKLGKRDAEQLAAKASKVIVAKGKKVTTFSINETSAKDETLLAHMLGPTGNLRAPTIVRGKTVLVGFSDEVYEDVLGG